MKFSVQLIPTILKALSKNKLHTRTRLSRFQIFSIASCTNLLQLSQEFRWFWAFVFRIFLFRVLIWTTYWWLHTVVFIKEDAEWIFLLVISVWDIGNLGFYLIDGWNGITKKKLWIIVQFMLIWGFWKEIILFVTGETDAFFISCGIRS